jgi:hypothetical protein
MAVELHPISSDGGCLEVISWIFTSIYAASLSNSCYEAINNSTVDSAQCWHLQGKLVLFRKYPPISPHHLYAWRLSMVHYRLQSFTHVANSWWRLVLLFWPWTRLWSDCKHVKITKFSHSIFCCYDHMIGWIYRKCIDQRKQDVTCIVKTTLQHYHLYAELIWSSQLHI